MRTAKRRVFVQSRGQKFCKLAETGTTLGTKEELLVRRGLSSCLATIPRSSAAPIAPNSLGVNRPNSAAASV